MTRRWAPLGGFGLFLLVSASLGDEPRPVVSIRAVHPDRQLREVLDLFRGAKAPHPAAALAAWKRASQEPDRLGKPLEALIAAFNPSMVGELRTLDRAEVSLWFDPEDGQLAWGISLPADDGTFQALASSMVLSGGHRETSPTDPPADRLGKPGSPLVSRGSHGPLIAGSFEDLRLVRERADRAIEQAEPDGIRLEVEPGVLDGSSSVNVRRMAEALRTSRGSMAGRLALEGDAFTATLNLTLPEPVRVPEIDPTWLDWVPSERAVAGFALAIDPAAKTWDAAFRLADQVEKVDPARAGLAPIRLRLDLLARSVGVRTEADLIPKLRGISGWVGSDGPGIDSGLIALHLIDENAARQLEGRLKPRPEGGPNRIGDFLGRTIELARIGSSVAIGWGPDALAVSAAAVAEPERSAGWILRDGWGQVSPAFSGGLWPGRIPDLVPGDSPLCRSLLEAPPIRWSGFLAEPTRFEILVRWKELDTLVARFLGQIPLDPPPDR
ncbi:hypothetical protein P12x_004930 [Tundrisphaera lichenicola]|uniref:hypothetical protein n=1 Tax=Tundrisphaera lichenicola TaxID=2029860 RepID=UPI003EBFC276